MPIIKSAQKKLRQDKVRTQANNATKRQYKDAVKDVAKTAAAGKKVSADAVKTAYKKIDKAAKKNVIHANKAARMKSQVAALARGNK